MLVSIHKLKLILFLFLMAFTAWQLKGQQIWTLQQCLDTALVKNKTLQMGKNSIEISKQNKAEAKSNLIPKIVGDVNYHYFMELPYQYMPLSAFDGPEGQFKQVQFGVPHNISMSLQFTMPLYDPQIIGAIQKSKIASEISELQYQRSKEQVYYDISSLYYNATILYHQLSFINSNIKNNRRLLENVLLLQSQLLANENDVNKIQLQLEQLTTQKEIIYNNYKQLINALKFSIGIGMDQPIEIDPDIVYQKSIEYSIFPSIDVHLASKQSILLKSEIKTMKKSRLPSIALFGSYGTNGYGYFENSNEFIDFHATGFAGLKLSIPVFNGTITQKKIKQKNIALKNSQLQESLLSDQNNMQINNASQKRIVALATVETVTHQIELATSVYEQTLLQQKQGIANLTEVLMADYDLIEAQQNYLSAVISYLKADLELKKLTGNISFIN